MGIRVAELSDKLNEKPTIKHLIEKLGHSDPYVRTTAGLDLVRIGEPAIVPLIEALDDPGWLGHDYAAKVLDRIILDSHK